MSQRNPMNDRYKGDSAHKGSSRKSAGRAKPKSQAAASVYTPTAKQVQKRKEQQAKEKGRKSEAAPRADRAQEKAIIAADSEVSRLYKTWRRYWLICILVALVGVGASFAITRLAVDGGALANLAPYAGAIQIVGMVIGYAGIIFAIVIDMRKIRPFRKLMQGQPLSDKEASRVGLTEEDIKRLRKEAKKSAKKK